jgi:hypothetical protein
MAHSEFGCEFEIGNATRFFGLEGKTEVFCLGWRSDRRSACDVSGEVTRTSLMRFIVADHLSTSSFVCSYAASRSRRSCAR